MIKRNNPIRVLRNNVVIYEGTLESLRRFKDDVAEVKAGMECGIGVKNYNDVQPGDQIEVFERTERAAASELGTESHEGIRSHRADRRRVEARALAVVCATRSGTRGSANITIHEVRVGRDLAHAKVFFTCFPMDEDAARDRSELLNGRLAGFLRHALAQRVRAADHAATAFRLR